MAKVKYMGVADSRTIPKGDTLEGRVAEDVAPSKNVVFSRDNNWTVDSDEAGMSSEYVEALLGVTGVDFKDVTGMARIPSNIHQRMFLGHGASDALTPEEVAAAKEIEADLARAPSDEDVGGDASSTTTTSPVSGRRPR